MENNQVKELIAFIRTLCNKDGEFNEETAELDECKKLYERRLSKREEDIDVCNWTSRTHEELFFINQVCKKYSQLLGDIQYVEVGTHKGASAIAASLKNKNVKVWTIDSYNDRYDKDAKCLVSKVFKKFEVTDRVKLIIKDSSKIEGGDLTEKEFKSDQGINVFFYDGKDDDEGIIRQTFERLIPFMSDVCICIFDQKTVSERKPILSCLFKEVLGEKFTPEQFKEVSFNPPKSYGSSQFHCYLLKKNRGQKELTTI